MTDDELVTFLDHLYPTGDWPKSLRLLRVAELDRAGKTSSEIASTLKTTRKRVEELLSKRPLAPALLGLTPHDIPSDRDQKVRKVLGDLILGRAAETAFEDIYRSTMNPTEFKLEDSRQGRTDTDYRLLNGGGKYLYRINIKFFGSNFRRGVEFVGLQPEDCFPLATYKIHGALQKQHQEHRPYIFVIVGVPGLTGATLAPAIDDKYVRPLTWISASSISGKRDFEDRVVEQIVEDDSAVYRDAYDRIRAAEWYVLSARRADNLLREKLFDRVFALRVRSFAQTFKGAELDMHFSLSADLITLKKFFDILKDEGQTHAASLLERGTI